jgi:hypothetical protein
MNSPLFEILAYLLSTAGAGAAASALFDQFRAWWKTTPADTGYPKVDRLVDSILNTRAGARLAVFILSAAISTLAAGLLAHLTGQPIGPSIEKALYAALASQVYHVKTLIGQPSAGEVVTFTPEARS